MEVQGYFHGLEVCGTVTKSYSGDGQPLYEVDGPDVYSENGEDISDLLTYSAIEQIQDFLIEIAKEEGL